MSDCITDKQGRLPCTCSKLHTANSDGSDPHGETRDTVEIALDFALFAVALASLVFSVAALAGFFWSK